MSGDTKGADGEGVQSPKASLGGPGKVLTDSLAKPLAKRFYAAASVSPEAPHTVLLDGRPVKTPKRRALALPTPALAAAVAEEWAAQSTNIDPARMPLTRFANTAIDAVADEMPAVANDICAYAGSDLVCYRAQAPEELRALQARDWNPVLQWAARALDARFIAVAGVMHTDQPPEALARFATALEPHEPFRLTGLHVLTTLTGSALLALAHERGELDARTAWDAAHVDEDYQILQWGEDAEAAARRAARWAEFQAASRFLTLLKSAPAKG